jgi:hypothetical protein
MTPKIRKETRRGQTTWIVDYKKAGKRKRSRCATRADAERKHGELVEQLRDHGQIVMDITEPERRELHQVFAEAKRMGVSMRDVWAGYLAGGRGSVLPAITLGEAVKQLVAAKRAAKRALRYVDGLESYLTQFIAGRESVQVASITPRRYRGMVQWSQGRRQHQGQRPLPDLRSVLLLHPARLSHREPLRGSGNGQLGPRAALSADTGAVQGGAGMG